MLVGVVSVIHALRELIVRSRWFVAWLNVPLPGVIREHIRLTRNTIGEMVGTPVRQSRKMRYPKALIILRKAVPSQSLRRLILIHIP